jgi:hypothetical protein
MKFATGSLLMPKDNNFSYDQSLCWDCALATQPWKCEWADRFEPVPGWEAEECYCGQNGSGYESYNVIACPKFKRDSYAGGLAKDPMCRKRIMLDDPGVRELSEAIIERAVDDWKELMCGKLASTRTSDGKAVKRDELIRFFFSGEFASMLNSFSKYTPAQIRRFLDVHDEAFYAKEDAKREKKLTSQT